MMRVWPCELPRSCPGRNCSSPSTRRPRRASSKRAAEPMPPVPRTMTSKVQALFNQLRQDADRGEHSVGGIWRRERLSCPNREQLGGFLLQALDPDLLEYIEFHLTTVGCAFCGANLDDLKRLQAEAPAA